MPQVTVYIREEDLETWKGIVKKSEFIHNALQNLSTYDGAPIVLRETVPPEADEEDFVIEQVPHEDSFHDYKWDPRAGRYWSLETDQLMPPGFEPPKPN